MKYLLPPRVCIPFSSQISKWISSGNDVTRLTIEKCFLVNLDFTQVSHLSTYLFFTFTIPYFAFFLIFLIFVFTKCLCHKEFKQSV